MTVLPIENKDNPIRLGSHQVVNLDAETGQCLDSMLNNFQDVCQLMELRHLEPVSPVQVKGRLDENIAFWKDIGASRWELSIIENSYYYPFISPPAGRSFQNHHRVVQNQEFVYQDLQRLVVSGAVVEDVAVVNPLGVANNESGKCWLPNEKVNFEPCYILLFLVF